MDDATAALGSALAGRYRIDRKLGTGGMATVYLAQDVRHDRPVALKVLHPDLAQALGAERFQREIKLAARLQHPHILTVHDSGEDAGQLWFTMPFVEGESLRDRLDREKQLPVEDALRIARESADALAYAHEHGIVHRDIKPENILLSGHHALVADFGIARALGANSGSQERLTGTGMSLGTAAYMSPEQAAGEREVDARSDVYSLGIVLYEMLAGETPFAAATPQAMIARRFTDTARPLRQIRDTVPEYVEQAVQKALSRTAADRYSTAAEFAAAVTAPNQTTGTIATTPGITKGATGQMRGSSRTRAVWIAAAAVVLVALGSGTAWWLHGRGTSDSGTTATAGVIRLAVLPFDNVGDSSDAYFAEGMTDAVRGKLTSLPNLDVIARTSSESYRSTRKTPGQIAKELGVRYLLTGTVRWAKASDGTSRVQVSPELVEIDSDAGSARSRWQQPFDAPLTDVFQVQGDIAGKVASALDVALGVSDRQQLASRPTKDLDAYDAYLKGDAIYGSSDADWRRAASFLEQAVTRDSTFGLAWAKLALARITLYENAIVKPSDASIDTALVRAQQYAPDAPATYRARSNFAVGIQNDARLGIAIAEEGIARNPGNSDLLRTVGYAEIAVGNTDAGMEKLRRALVLDPRSILNMRGLGQYLILMHRWTEARTLLVRSLEIDPGDMSTLQGIILSYLGAGDFAGARRALAAAKPSSGRARFLAFNAMYWDLYWLLDRAQQDSTLTYPVSFFEGAPGGRALAFAEIYHQRGDTVRMHMWADSARIAFEAIAHKSAAAQVPAVQGLALALEGRFPEAIALASKGIAAAPKVNAGGTRQYLKHALARIYILAGDKEKAIDIIEPLLKDVYVLSPGWLRIDPAFAPLKGNPRFEKLVNVSN